MACIYRFQGQTLQGITDPALPGTTGYGDLGSAVDGQHALTLDNIRNGTHAMSGRTVPVVRFVDNGLSGEPRWEIRFGATPDKSTPTRLTGPYSMRFYYRQSSTSSTVTQPIMMFRDGTSTLRYELASAEQTRPAFAGLSGAVTAMSPATGMFRFELQVDPNRSPKCVLRIYVEDGTGTVHRSTTASPASTEIDRIWIGHYFSGNYTPSEVQYADIEIHDDYDLGGQFTSNPTSPTAASTTATGSASTTPTVAAAYNYDAGTNRSLPASTLVAGTHYTVSSNVSYTTAGTFGRALDLYVPTGTAPSGGWPVVLWAHSGFFVGGSKDTLPPAWRDDLLANGYAVASVQYVLSSVDALTPYDDYGGGTNRGGRYPSHILDYKRAAAFLRDNASTYGINGTKLIATGYSAGGYVALGAAVTRGLAADSAGNQMSLAAAAGAGRPWADGYTGSDPVFLGAFVYCAPVDLDLAAAWDPTFPNAGGTINAAYRGFQGLLQTGGSAPTAAHTSLAALVGLNKANVPDVAYVRGTADYLVHWAHEDALATAMADPAVAGSYVEFTTPNNHDRANFIYDDSVIVDWLDAVVNPGSPADVTPSAVARTVAVPAPTVAATRNVSTAVPAVARTVAVPAPTISTTSTASALVTPNAVARPVQVLAATVATTSAATATPGAATGTVSVPAPTVATTASARFDGEISDDLPVYALANVPAPTVTVTGSALVTPSAVGVAALPRTASVSTSGTTIVTPNAVTRTVAVPAPTVTITGSALVTPGQVPVVGSVPAPAVSTSGATTVTPDSVARTVAVPAPTVTVTGSALVTPGVATTAVGALAPSVQVEGSTILSPPRALVTATVPTPAASGSGQVDPVTVTVSAAVLTPSVTTSALATPAPVAVDAAARTPGVSNGEILARSARLLPGRHAAALS